jgi:hypothetical protein
MAYNLKTDQTAYHVKLTAIGRQLLSQGTLTYTSFAVGDSEVDYAAATATGLSLKDLRVLRPVDSQPDLKYPVLPQPGVAALAPLYGTVGETKLIRNSAPSRGPFRAVITFGTETLLDTALPASNGAVVYVRDRCHVSTNGTALVQSDKAGLNASIGDWLLVHAISPVWAPAVQALADTYVFDPTEPGVYLFYRITAINGSTLTLDRPAPVVSVSGGCPAFILPGGDAIETVYGQADPVADWDEDQLAYVPVPPIASAEVGLWNCNILYGSGVMGSELFPWASYPSNSYDGTRRYLGYGDTESPIAVIHYSNHVVHNLYGESLTGPSVGLVMPSIMWWNSPSGLGGLVAYADATRQQTTGGGPTFNLIYHKLLDIQGYQLGRVYPALKLIVLDDPELVTALSAKSNRNWTLPPFQLATAASSVPVPVASATSRVLHVSYAFESPGGGGWDATQGYGLQSAMPCQYLQRYPGALAQLQYFEFKLDSALLQHFHDGSVVSSPAGTGYTAQGMCLLFQETIGTAAVVSDAWFRVDVTPYLVPAVPAGYQLNASAVSGLLRVSGDLIRAAKAAALAGGGFYQLPATGPAGGLSFGEETVFFGNVHTDIEALAFRTSFQLNLPSGQYATSTNPTWLPGLPVAITELAIYDATASLVAIGKLTDPVSKGPQDQQFLEVTLDF